MGVLATVALAAGGFAFAVFPTADLLTAVLAAAALLGAVWLMVALDVFAAVFGVVFLGVVLGEVLSVVFDAPFDAGVTAFAIAFLAGLLVAAADVAAAFDLVACFVTFVAAGFEEFSRDFLDIRLPFVAFSGSL